MKAPGGRRSRVVCINLILYQILKHVRYNRLAINELRELLHSSNAHLALTKVLLDKKILQT